MAGISYILALAVHSLFILWLAKGLGKWKVPLWGRLVVAFAVFGVLLGIITAVIPDHSVQLFINPFGTRAGDVFFSASLFWFGCFIATLIIYTAFGLFLYGGHMLRNQRGSNFSGGGGRK
ncbi:MAG: hypothetical protein HN929_12590 [Chloroflexi bacterium]|jgi:hypothetical protein|nr:hypothetical protein [Chloroflexota bacterium]MBT7082279.1 hypothetical protein [Chloroflexota bacterium]MBT7290061.1 hypothetical protein [Chloroflexota bacterium]